MSELRPTSPVRRPGTARPRTATEHAHDAPTSVVPPSSVEPITLDELGTVLRDMVSLPVHAGARLIEDKELGVLRVRLPGAGRGHGLRGDATLGRRGLA